MTKIISQYRVCTNCNTQKHISEFHTMVRRGRIEARTRCIVCEREIGRNWAKSNKDIVSAKNKKYHLENLEKERKRSLAYSKSNPDKYRVNAKRFRENNPEKKKFWDKRWVQNNPIKCLLNGQTRKARIKGNGGVITKKEWVSLCEKYNYTCLRCGRNDVPMTLDHVVPIFLGGKNEIENAQPLCKSCNSIKNTKIIDYRR